MACCIFDCRQLVARESGAVFQVDARSTEFDGGMKEVDARLSGLITGSPSAVVSGNWGVLSFGIAATSLRKMAMVKKRANDITLGCCRCRIYRRCAGIKSIGIRAQVKATDRLRRLDKERYFRKGSTSI